MSEKLSTHCSLLGTDLVGEHSKFSEVRPRGLVENLEETLPARVAINQVRTLIAENLRFPEEGQSAQG
jgi:hypothetical protein